ncbi:type II secretion system protein F [Anaerocolumna sedimenticola]|uniref:Type II secretion system protein F n=1 Tax=Anaerocolumna sedimenticola TaxID=2696063 RepID=A0A6P1TLS8_9FIRM|nr:type II secretion system F family protein [Anaerocolumna sedimenticola]QHQ60248.1 type II secretion system protein F [Anaerocolumna sedimenticola]
MDYNNYQTTKKEQIRYFIQGILIGTGLGILFYSNLLGILLLMPYAFIHVHSKKKQLVEKRKWQLNLEFRDGLASLSAALNAGYSVENAFSQAVTDLKLLYSPDALIVKEFEGIVNKLDMNRPVEDALSDFAERSGLDDIKNFAEVFITAKRTGGDIIKIIRSTGNTISDKIEVRREIVTLISGKKLEADIMSLIPIGIILYLRFFSSGFLNPLYHNPFGFLFMSAVLILYYGVYQLTQKIISIEV